MKRRLLIMLLCFMMIPFDCVYAEGSESIELYVSTSGSDSNDGSSLESPLASLAGARERVSNLNDGSKNIIVNFLAGEYEIDSAVSFTADDSGKNGKKITYRAYNNQSVSFTGSKEITSEFVDVTDTEILGRLNDTIEGKIKQISLAAIGIESLPETTITTGVEKDYQAPYPMLFADNSEQVIARYPNSGYNTFKEADIIAGSTGAAVSFHIDSANAELYGADSVTEAFIDGYFNSQWAYEQSRVTFDVATRSVTSKQSLYNGVAVNGRWRINNLLEELDSEGEYYIDKKSMIMYYYPEADFDENTKLELAVYDGDVITATGLENVEFSGLTFEKTLGNAFSVSNCQNISITNCNFKNIGNYGINAEDGKAVSVTSCNFTNIGASAVDINAGDRQTLTSGECVVKNNKINGYAQKNRGRGNAIFIKGVGQVIENNTITDGPLGAIRFFGNEHKISHNEIYAVNKDGMDLGAIYGGGDWTYRGNEISYNYIHDIASSRESTTANCVGIYLDDMISGINVYNNVIYNVTKGILAGGGRYNTLENNIIIGCDYPFEFDARGEGWAKDQTVQGGKLHSYLTNVPYNVEPYLTKYPELAGIMEDSPGSPKYNIIRNNILYKNDNSYSISNSVISYAKEYEKPIDYLSCNIVSSILNQGYLIENDSGSFEMPTVGEMKIDNVSFSEIDEIISSAWEWTCDFEGYADGELPEGFSVTMPEGDSVSVATDGENKVLKVVKTEASGDLNLVYNFPKTSKKYAKVSFDVKFGDKNNGAKGADEFASLYNGETRATYGLISSKDIRYGSTTELRAQSGKILPINYADTSIYYTIELEVDFEASKYTLSRTKGGVMTAYRTDDDILNSVGEINNIVFKLNPTSEGVTDTYYFDNFKIEEYDAINLIPMVGEVTDNTVTVTGSAENKSQKDLTDGMFYVVVYTSNGRLYDVDMCGCNVDAGGTIDTLSATVDVPAEGEYSIWGYVWNSKQSPLRDEMRLNQ